MNPGEFVMCVAIRMSLLFPLGKEQVEQVEQSLVCL